MKLLWIQLALGLFQADLAVKQEVETNPEFQKECTFLNGWIQIRKLYNYGMAGGKFVNHMPLIIKCSGIATLISIVEFIRVLVKGGATVRKLGFAFLTGGALSNLYDRCKKGYVVDYVSFRTPWRWLSNLVFNLSDFFIFTGAVLICSGQTDRTQR
ncbi:MAG: signal peptidase II [Lachnospiraceae bacterium]|nr:signal peptidase II [Lachnospiraceae bacterium]